MVKPLASPSIVSFVRPFTRQASCRYAPLQSASKLFSTSNARREEEERYGNRGRDLREGTPRWKSTPARYKAPVRSKPPVLNNDFVVNEDPSRLDRAYVRILGRGGETMLTEEVKWLAVTHKSFDHGKRGYNDRLAFLGMIDLKLKTQREADPNDGQARELSIYRLHWHCCKIRLQSRFLRCRINTGGNLSDTQRWRV